MDTAISMTWKLGRKAHSWAPTSSTESETLDGTRKSMFLEVPLVILTHIKFENQ